MVTMLFRQPMYFPARTIWPNQTKFGQRNLPWKVNEFNILLIIISTGSMATVLCQHPKKAYHLSLKNFPPHVCIVALQKDCQRSIQHRERQSCVAEVCRLFTFFIDTDNCFTVWSLTTTSCVNIIVTTSSQGKRCTADTREHPLCMHSDHQSRNCFHKKNRNTESPLSNLKITHQSALTEGKQGTVIHGEEWVNFCQPKLNSKQASREAVQ